MGNKPREAGCMLSNGDHRTLDSVLTGLNFIL